MGLIGNFIDKVGSSKIGKVVFQPGGLVDTITKPIQAVGVVVSNPITTITKGYAAAKEKVLTDSVEKSIGKVLLNTGTIAAAVVTGGTSAGRVVATNAAKSLVPKTLVGKAAAAGGVVVATGILTKTDKPIEALSKTPSALFNFGQNAGALIDDPSLKAAEKLLKENPLISSVVVGGAVAAGAGSLLTGIGALENIKTRESVQDLTDTLKTNNSVSNALPTEKFTLTDTSKEKVIAANPNIPSTPITPQTGSLVQSSRGTVKRAKRKSTLAVPQNISQRVNVIVQNKNSSIGIKQNKKYLNARTYAR